MSEDPPRPPPLPTERTGGPPPAPLPADFVREGLARLRIPGSIVLIGVVAQLIIYLIAAGWDLVLMGIVLSNLSQPNGDVAGAVFFGVGAAFNLLSIGVLGFIAYGGVRMMRAHGYGMALAGGIVQITWGCIHAILLIYSAVGVGCVLGPIEGVIALLTGTVALAVLADNRVYVTFMAVERHPELLDESAGEG